MDSDRELMRIAVSTRLVYLTEKHLDEIEKDEVIKKELTAILNSYDRSIEEKAHVCALFTACAIAVKHGRAEWSEVQEESRRLLDPNASPHTTMGREVYKVRDRLVRWVVLGIKREER